MAHLPTVKRGLQGVAFVGTSANMDKLRLLEIIKQQLKAKGLSASEASERAVGNPYLISNMGRKRYGMPSTENLVSLCDVLGLEFYVGPPRDTAHQEQKTATEEEYAQVPLHAAALAAGTGRLNSNEHVEGHLAFKRSWLRKIGVAPSNAVLARVATGDLGESMLPTIHPGDMILIDTSRTEIPQQSSGAQLRRGPIYAFTTNGGARVKRISHFKDAIILASDNPEIPPEFVDPKDWQSFNVIGKVMWWGHTVTD